MKRLRKHLTPGRTIALGFLALILLGALLLSLPAARTESMVSSPLDSLFTAASAACVSASDEGPSMPGATGADGSGSPLTV